MPCAIIFEAPMLREENTNEQRSKNTMWGQRRPKRKEHTIQVFYYHVEPYKHNNYMAIEVICKYNYESVILQTGVPPHSHVC